MMIHIKEIADENFANGDNFVTRMNRILKKLEGEH